VLHLHSYGAGLEFVLEWARTHNLVTIYQEHATPDLTKRRFYRLPTGLNKSTIVVAVSQFSAQALRELCGVTRPIEVVPPITAVGGQDIRSKQAARQDDNVLHIATIARLGEEKGLNFLIQAAEIVVAAWPDVRFTLYGEGDLRGNLEAQIEAAQLGRHVHLPGSFKRDELPGIMSTVDIFVLPSLTEGFPLSITEAMAYGCPIVATSVGGIPELIEDGLNGLLCQSGDPEGLAQKICALIEDPTLRMRLGSEARESYEHGPFQPASVCEQFASIYAKALQNGSEWIWSQNAYSDAHFKV
jgi:glycosyltransferase involved in cell wall biosynthesis